MMAIQLFTAAEVVDRVRDMTDESDGGQAWLQSTVDVMNRWLVRGDGIAVYQNQDLGHPDIGARQFISFGSPAAQCETESAPEQLPDIGGAINWRYRLEGTYRGDQLTVS